ncbi:VOC family protein [Salegentibacter sediminis]|uniref:VOC family protein n=1 Tax=Salegentibacter sediminis TaxID=1930251 RepID=UPI0009BD178F|nr:VOC family protein [Salegentibacter sediminis]
MKICRLQLYTSNFREQLHFYRDTLGLKVKQNSEENFEVQVGYSLLEFQYQQDAKPYHIAFHIPDNQEGEALEWVKERVPVIKNNREEIIDFSAWNAKSLYFYDADKNILEFISRGDFSKPKSALFSEKSILGIAEIGIGTTQVRDKFNFLNAHFGLEKYDGDFEKFCAIGDDEGLLITINRNKKDWFPADDKIYAAEFRVDFRYREKEHQLIFENDHLKTLSE